MFIKIGFYCNPTAPLKLRLPHPAFSLLVALQLTHKRSFIKVPVRGTRLIPQRPKSLILNWQNSVWIINFSCSHQLRARMEPKVPLNDDMSA